MRRFLILIFFVGVCATLKSQHLTAFAKGGDNQSPVFLSSYPHFDNVVLPPGYRMKKVGSTLTVAGAALFIGGIIMIANADYTSYYSNGVTYYDYDEKIVYGSLMLVGGGGMIVPGIIFWTKGARKYNRYLENLQGSVHANGSGLAIRLTF